MQSLKRILKSYQIDEDKQRRISREWQDYAYRLALELEDLEHKAIYMRLAKNEDRSLLEEVRIFVRGANAKNKGGLFMWKLKQLREKKKDGGVKKW
ncbi:hypothetical protein [Candidatus Chazhemtobacterium aquaticus]|uniref:Uncharacterized protein n=1 Tax=Candidatus Chazhemtobacterium aquaticus TaxID=2715735 RepID=A0A857N6Q6_9BACT|nr:hypothetical protein [Candidatus Chazhemtobacterium aquaticus]QHO63033.1 hypothetical protein MICH65_0052 [Candidatus Chazhemtobacterium aquaticus]